jgi:hypothetical protein
MSSKTRVPLLSAAIIAGVTLGVLQGVGFSQTGPAPHGDADGGFEADYSGIPRLQWMGPGQPGTYREYLRSHPGSPLSSTPVYLDPTGGRSGRATKALVLVESSLYAGIQTNLARYVTDLQSDGYTVDVHQITGGTPASLKAFLLANSTDVVGCVFVGDLPVSWFEAEVWGHEEFPCDLFYMDLDGTWTDSDGDGKFDGHSAGTGDEGPEIFIGRIDTSMMSGDEATITNSYLDKDHNFRAGLVYAPDYALTYTEDDWAGSSGHGTDIQYSYPGFDDIRAPNTNRDDYMYNRVSNPVYQFIQLSCHSSAGAHYFTRGGYANSSSIMAAPPHSIFYNLFCCSSLRFTEWQYLGGAYIYNSSLSSLAVIGSTKTGSMLSFHAFYQPFGAGESLGEAYRQWFNYLAPYNDIELAWHYGMTIAGDPFLRRIDPALHIVTPDDSPSGYQPPGTEVSVTLEIRAGSQNYQPGTGFLHCRLDPLDPFTAVPLAPLGGGLFEAVLPGTRPGDAPEFYFGAQGDGGTTVFHPQNAPLGVHSFEIGLERVVFEETFSADPGWTTEGRWAWGTPTGGGGAYGNPDPTSGHTGSNVYGYELDGDYANNLPAHHLTSSAFDFSNIGGARLEYWRWLNLEQRVSDHAEVSISTDGTSWTRLWRNAPEITDSAWQPVSHDLPSLADGQSSVYLRWTLGTTNAVKRYSGWNIDDVSIVGYDRDPTLWAEEYEISVASGGSTDLILAAGAAHGGEIYIVAGSLSGSRPGFDIAGMHVPLNWDQFTGWTLHLAGTGYFQGFTGVLDGQGEALATFDTQGPLDLGMVGTEVDFVYATLPPSGFVSNAVTVTFVD